ADGKIVREGKVASEPETLIGWFNAVGFAVERIGLEAGPQSQWLFAKLMQAGVAMGLIETRHAHAAFTAIGGKTDRKDARNIAHLMRLGRVPPGHCQALPAQETWVLLTARKLVQAKLGDVEMSLRGTLRGFGLKVGRTTKKQFAGRVTELVEGHAMLEVIAQALLAVREVMLRELNALEK